MNTLAKAAYIRRAVDNQAYKLLSNCKEPEKAYDGDDYYMQEYWEIDPIDLHEAVSVHLEDEDVRYGQIEFFVNRFLESEEYEQLQEQFREDYYEHQELERDPYSYFGVSQSDFIAIK